MGQGVIEEAEVPRAGLEAVSPITVPSRAGAHFGRRTGALLMAPSVDRRSGSGLAEEGAPSRAAR
jgi:hypothetical protein